MSDTKTLSAKPFSISKHLIMEAFKRVKNNRGSAGIDAESIEKFELKLQDNLYKIWNRMSSGSYFPPAVKLVDIPKKSGETRKLGIPTVSDRVAQMVVKMLLEPKLEPIFHNNSFGYRPNRSAHDAITQARQMCFRYCWVLEFDIKGLFDHIDHDLLLKAVTKHVGEDDKWMVMYIERWLKVPFETAKGVTIERNSGTPQGGVISPLLSNLFLHYCFDLWMERNFQDLPFERFADDGIVHCCTEKQANFLLERLKRRFEECKLEIHPTKSQIVYCKSDKRRPNNHPLKKFVFLGYEFRERLSKAGSGNIFVGFTPAVSPEARKKILDKIRSMNLQINTDLSLDDLRKILNPVLQGWINYFGKFVKSELNSTMRFVNRIIVCWAIRKYKRFRRSQARARIWLKRIYKQNPKLFAHWCTGFSA